MRLCVFFFTLRGASPFRYLTMAGTVEEFDATDRANVRTRVATEASFNKLGLKSLNKGGQQNFL